MFTLMLMILINTEIHLLFKNIIQWKTILVKL